MAGARSLADGHHKVIVMTVKPANLAAPTLAELAAGTDISCAILSEGYQLGPTNSDTNDEKALCEEGNTKVITVANFEGSLTLFRYFDTVTKQADPVTDAAFQLFKIRGVTLWIYDRFTAKKSTEAVTAGDEGGVYEVVPDFSQNAPATGYIKKVVPLQVNGNSQPNAAAAA